MGLREQFLNWKQFPEARRDRISQDPRYMFAVKERDEVEGEAGKFVSKFKALEVVLGEESLVMKSPRLILRSDHTGPVSGQTKTGARHADRYSNNAMFTDKAKKMFLVCTYGEIELQTVLNVNFKRVITLMPEDLSHMTHSRKEIDEDFRLHHGRRGGSCSPVMTRATASAQVLKKSLFWLE